MREKKNVALALSKLTLDPRCSPRALGPEPAKVQEYYEAITDGSAAFPPLDVVSDGEHNWLVDGRLRLEAYRMAGRSHVECVVTAGTLREARLRAASVNASHGLPRTNQDKRQQVWNLLALLDEEGSVNRWSASQVAKHCSVSQPLVLALKRLFLEQKAATRKKQEAAASAALEMASPPAEAAELNPEDGFLPSPVIASPPLPPADDEEDDGDLDDGDIDRLDGERTLERAYRALRKASRFAHALGLTLEKLIVRWREAGQNTDDRDRERQLAALLEKERQKAERDAAKPKSPWAD